MRLDGDGEILVKGPDQFEGYWNKPDATRADQSSDGWLHTGDVGEWQDGTLRLIDRARDFLVTAGGKTISPSGIESIAARQPLYRRGDRVRSRPQISHRADRDRLRFGRRLGARQRRELHRLHILVQSEVVQGLIKAEIDKANTEFARVEQIKAFRILPKELDPEQDGEPVTPTRKVKRNLMYDRFKDLVEGMYDDTEERLLAAERAMR